MVSSRGSLTPLQRQILTAFFERETGFFLTGDAALAGFHLMHRPTDDLDLFTNDDDAFERGRAVIQDVANMMGAALSVVQNAPGFQRYAFERGEEIVIIDLVRERTPQLEKQDVAGIRIDSIEEIQANKLTTIVSRAEERDLVDLLLLERSGRAIEDALELAQQKDGGCTAATLAWVLSEVDVPDGATLPAGVDPKELRSFVADLVKRFRRLAHPG